MIWIILWLLTLLGGAAEEAPMSLGEVVTEECTKEDGKEVCFTEDSTPPPSELPGPRR